MTVDVFPFTPAFERIMATQWFIRHDNKTNGPYSSAQLRAAALNGQLRHDFLISNDQKTWLRVSEVKELILGDATESSPAAGASPAVGAAPSSDVSNVLPPAIPVADDETDILEATAVAGPIQSTASPERSRPAPSRPLSQAITQPVPAIPPSDRLADMYKTRLIAVAAAASVLFLAVGIGIGYWLRRPAETHETDNLRNSEVASSEPATSVSPPPAPTIQPQGQPPSQPSPAAIDNGTATHTTPVLENATAADSVAPIQAPPLAGDKATISLPSNVANVAVGGGGRFLILHLPQMRKLAIFDVNEAKIVKYIPLPEDDICFTAGMDKLIVGLPLSNSFQRWSLQSMEREVTVPNPLNGSIADVVMGNASAGPLFVCHSKGVALLNPRTFRELDMKPKDQRMPGCVAGLVRASADGTLFAMREGRGGEGHTMSRILVHGDFVNVKTTWMSASLLIPSHDGRYLCSAYGIYSPDMACIYPKSETPDGYQFVPAVQGDLILHLVRPDSVGDLEVMIPGQYRQICTLRQVPGVVRDNLNYGGNAADKMQSDKRLFLIPSAKLFVSIPTTNDKLVLRRFDLDKLLAESDTDYLFVASMPPREVRPGGIFKYDLDVKSRRGGVKTKLESGPEGMRLSPEGKLTWAVPAAAKKQTVDVILSISDATEQETFQSFQIQVQKPDDTENVATNVAGGAAPTKGAPPTKSPIPPTAAVGTTEGKPELSPTRSANPQALSHDKPAPGEKTAEHTTAEHTTAEHPAAAADSIPLVRAPTASMKIEPTKLKEDTATITLPGPIAHICVGGNGRFVIMHLPEQRQIAIFDTVEAKVVKYLPVAEDKVYIAAGMEKLMVVLADKNIVQRWELNTFSREVSALAPLDRPGAIHSAAMGSASAGPLVLVARVGMGGPRLRSPVVFLDIQTMNQVSPDGADDRSPLLQFHPSYPPTLAVSSDGRVLGLWTPGLSPSGLCMVTLLGRSIKAIREHTSVGHILPSPDGRYVFTADGVFTSELKRVGKPEDGEYSIPAIQGPYYLSLGPLSYPGRNRGNDKTSGAALRMIGDSRLLTTVKLPELEGAFDLGRRVPDGIAPYQRVMLIPAAKLLVVVPASNDRLVLHRFDLDEIMDKSGIDYLYVTSDPPAGVARGGRLDYPVKVRSKKGGVKYKLESGPKDLTVSPDGRVTWSVPSSIADKEVNVLVSITDASGQEIFHSFKLAINDAAAKSGATN
jgi:hypothetical protein